MKLKDVIAGLPVLELRADPDTEITAVECDSRSVEPGSLFAAIPGFTADGHKYIPKAAANGCAAVLCQTPPEIDVPYILVEDSRLGDVGSGRCRSGQEGDAQDGGKLRKAVQKSAQTKD